MSHRIAMAGVAAFMAFLVTGNNDILTLVGLFALIGCTGYEMVFIWRVCKGIAPAVKVLHNLRKRGIRSGILTWESRHIVFWISDSMTELSVFGETQKAIKPINDNEATIINVNIVYNKKKAREVFSRIKVNATYEGIDNMLEMIYQSYYSLGTYKINQAYLLSGESGNHEANAGVFRRSLIAIENISRQRYPNVNAAIREYSLLE